MNPNLSPALTVQLWYFMIFYCFITKVFSLLEYFAFVLCSLFYPFKCFFLPILSLSHYALYLPHWRWEGTFTNFENVKKYIFSSRYQNIDIYSSILTV